MLQVIHAGWIVHCVDEAFQVPISKYILDGRLFYTVIQSVLSCLYRLHVPPNPFQVLFILNFECFYARQTGSSPNPLTG